MIQPKYYATMNGRNEVWLGRWYRDGRRFSRTLGKVADMNERQLEEAEQRLFLEVNGDKATEVEPGKMTLTGFVEWRMDILASARSATRRDCQLAFDHLIKVVGANIQVRAIKRTHMRKLQRQLRANGMAGSTISKTLSSLRTSWNVGIGDDLLTVNPFAKHGETCEAKTQRIYSSDEIAAMVQSCPSDWWAMFIRLLATSGLRRTEALRLQWKHIDFDAATVTVARQDPGTFKVNGKSYPMLAWRAKAKASYRTIPLPPETMTCLRRWRLKSGPSEYIFVGLDRLTRADRLLQAGKLDDDYPLKTSMTRAFNSIQGRAQILLAKQRKVTVDQLNWVHGCLHDFRDTYLTANKHQSIDVLMRIAGHGSMKTTLKYYLSERPGDAADVREAVKLAGLAVG